MPIAIGIVVCGTGVGTIVFALMEYYLLSLTDWRTSFLVQALLTATMSIAAISFKPIKPVRIDIIDHKPSTSKSYIKNDSKGGNQPSFHKKEVSARISVSSLRSLKSAVWQGYLEPSVVYDFKKKGYWGCNCCTSCKKNPPQPIKNPVLILEDEEFDLDDIVRKIKIPPPFFF